MSISKDGTKVSIGGQTFVRTVLPSATTPKKTEQDLETAFEELDQMRTQEQE